ncbi:MAG TPA: hypothetical protein IAB97_07840 [Candidatus Choladousia intestinipullorum]|nr:hypothetical protein [Candidatus Choladousia intestinipullorum]
MKRKLTGNLGLKLLSLIMAFFIWLLVSNIDNPTVSRLFREVKINIINEDSVTEIDRVMGIVSEDTVTLRVTAPENILNTLTRDSFTVVADMENLTEMNTVPLSVTCSNPSVTWDRIEILPSSLKVELEQKEQSEFAVTITTTGDVAEGYEVGRMEIVQGKTVQIAGPESVINRIGQVVATVSVNYISSDQRLPAQLQVYDKNGDPVSMDRLQIMDSTGVLLSDNTVMVDVSLWEKQSIPIEVNVSGTPADGYRLAGVSVVPDSVNLAGTEAAFESLGGTLMLNDAISVEGATESFTLDYDLTEIIAQYSELKLVDEADPTVTVSVQIEQSGDHTLAIPLSALEVLNRPTDMNLAFSPADEISVVIHSDGESAPIQQSQIIASIDLSVCAEEGTYEIPVNIELPEGYTLVSEVKLVVTATKPVVEGAS